MRFFSLWERDECNLKIFQKYSLQNCLKFYDSKNLGNRSECSKNWGNRSECRHWLFTKCMKSTEQAAFEAPLLLLWKSQPTDAFKLTMKKSVCLYELFLSKNWPSNYNGEHVNIFRTCTYIRNQIIWISWCMMFGDMSFPIGCSCETSLTFWANL